MTLREKQEEQEMAGERENSKTILQGLETEGTFLYEDKRGRGETQKIIYKGWRGGRELQNCILQELTEGREGERERKRKIISQGMDFGGERDRDGEGMRESSNLCVCFTLNLRNYSPPMRTLIGSEKAPQANPMLLRQHRFRSVTPDENSAGTWLWRQ